MVGSIRTVVLSAIATLAVVGCLVFVGSAVAAPASSTAVVASSSRSQATRMAREYLASQSFSRSGLIEQLEYEGFSRSDAIWGATHAGANWLTQAVKMAREYLRSQSFSRSGLIEQLEYEGFTRYQASYGASRAYR